MGRFITGDIDYKFMVAVQSSRAADRFGYLGETIFYEDEETKENRIQEIYGEAGLKLKNRVKDMDVRRGLNYKYFTGQDWGKAQNYDLALNRGSLGIEKCAQLIVDAASEE